MPRRNRPIKHRLYQPHYSCTHKQRFTSEALAKHAAEDQMLMHSDLDLAVYKCELCGGWHLTRNLEDSYR